jgi:uncharacterized protein
MNDSAVYKLRMRKRRGEEYLLSYNPHTSELFSLDNNKRLIIHPAGIGHEATPIRDWLIAPVVSPQNALSKNTSLDSLKIQLSPPCARHPEVTKDSLADAKAFVDGLPLWLGTDKKEGSNKTLQVEFWGCEPLRHWPALEHVATSLRMSHSPVEFTLVTDGSLLDPEKIAWLEGMNFSVVVRHDGPAQKFKRGTDIFDDPVQAENLRLLYQRLKSQGKIRFCCSLNGYNHSLAAVRDYLAAHLGCRAHGIPLSTEEMASPHSGKTGRATLSADGGQANLRHTLFAEISHGTAVHTHNIKEKLQDFYHSLAYERPSSSLGQFCAMDRENTLAVDLKGNALTCHAAVAEDGHAIGRVHDYANIRLNTAWHWSQREECSLCPVLQLCKGGCMKAEGAAWKQACDRSFTFHLSLLAAGLYFLTGGVLEEIEGNILRRPGLPSVASVIDPSVLS